MAVSSYYVVDPRIRGGFIGLNGPSLDTVRTHAELGRQISCNSILVAQASQQGLPVSGDNQFLGLLSHIYGPFACRHPRFLHTVSHRLALVLIP
ncbi:unnamed protein product [Fusarium graminearum]|uniref:Chromosome 1, complete genome n=1 Tax=Gibberella zeae (strain ATCC MYA-4620 / CBS 123657 / FGSC 9075 / NRRL 31084 / PH-1) TaxID=229533 RepID=A0A098D053_GIBZE|nr:unnamed protein product [Fusarium graminearum]